MPDGSREDFRLELNASTLELEGNIPEPLPQWTKLDFHQCPNCPLDISTHPHCSLAANIVGVGLLKKNGHDIGFIDFAKVGLPFTLAAVTAGAVFIWIFWS